MNFKSLVVVDAPLECSMYDGPEGSIQILYRKHNSESEYSVRESLLYLREKSLRERENFKSVRENLSVQGSFTSGSKVDINITSDTLMDLPGYQTDNQYRSLLMCL